MLLKIGLSFLASNNLKNIKALLLAAGLGTRLRPYTDIWPKCLMPIRNRPLLDYWLTILNNCGISNILVNTHYLSSQVEDFVNQPHFKNWVNLVYEPTLLGTAGTIRGNIDYCSNTTLLLAHADNWTCCNFSEFLDFHIHKRSKDTVMTMMTFKCLDPKVCGIVELDNNGIVVNFHEKVENPPGNIANAAVYLLEPEVIEWIKNNPTVTDFSNDVISHFTGKIATWENCEIHRDIGTINSLREAQNDVYNTPLKMGNTRWQKNFLTNKIHQLIKNDSQ